MTRTLRAFITRKDSGHLTDILASVTSNEAAGMLECDNNNMALKEEHQVVIEENDEDCRSPKVGFFFIFPIFFQ